MRTIRTSLFATIALLAGIAGANAQDNTLTVYTYESFTSEWGPGPKVKEAFEAECGCTLDFVPVADGDQLIGTITDRDIAVRAVAAGLSLTRVALLAHWASDVVAGFALGVAVERPARASVTRASGGSARRWPTIAAPSKPHAASRRPFSKARRRSQINRWAPM